MNRFRCAWRAFWTPPSSVVADQARACVTCAELRQQVDYWRKREERTNDMLLTKLGAAPVAKDPQADLMPAALAGLAMGLGIREIDSRKGSSTPGQSAE